MEKIKRISKISKLNFLILKFFLTRKSAPATKKTVVISKGN
jgi:hypothetical protein